jgi:hypothetical protein
MRSGQRHIVILTAGILLIFSSAARASCEHLVPIKNLNFGGLELIRACNIIPLTDLVGPIPDEENPCLSLPPSSPQEPLVNLVAQNMLYFNWEMPAANVSSMETVLGLADRGFRIVPVEIVRGEKPKYYLSLNFYSVVIAGVVNYRSEWSIYVAKQGDPKPRYMVIEVLSSEDAADPTYLPAPPEKPFLRPGTNVTYSIDESQVEVSNPDFHAAFSLLPGPGGQNQVRPANGKIVHVAQPWAEANDALYYLNGIADTALYNGNLAEADLLSINPNKVQISNSSTWSAFIGEKPEHVLLYLRPLDLAFTPYFNLNNSLGHPPEYTNALQTFKNITFGAYSYGHAFQVLEGLAEPLVRFDVLVDSVPSIFINFNIPRKNARALESLLDLPQGFKLARSRMTEGRPAQYLLTLNIYETVNVLTGLTEQRAEWSVYVEDHNDPSAVGRYLMVIDVNSNAASLNPVDLFTNPTVLEYELQGGRLSADIKADPAGEEDKFYIEFDMPSADAPPVSLRQDWILANDRIYWRNGIYDRLLYNGLLLDAEVVEVNPDWAVINDNTPWAEFVDETPVQIAVFKNPLQFVIRPWYNTEELCLGQ